MHFSRGRIVALTTSLMMSTTLCSQALGSQALAAETATSTADPRAASAPSSDVGEVIVTSRRRAESLQNVPLAITAVTGAELRKDGVQDLRDVSTLTPGLVINDQGAQFESHPIIRGLAQQDAYTPSDNNVSTFLDGLYISNANVINLSDINLARIEVVKGPNSALYGRNAFAGAINYVSELPAPDYQGSLAVTFGTDGKAEVVPDVSIPVIKDKLQVRLIGVYNSSDGYWSDPVNHRHLNGFEDKDAQFLVTAAPIEHLSLTGMVYYGSDLLDPPAISIQDSNCGSGATAAYCGLIPTGKNNPVPIQSPPVSLAGDNGNNRNVLLSYVKAKYDLGFSTIESLTGYSDTVGKTYLSWDNYRNGAPFALTPGPGVIDLPTYLGEGNDANKDFSEELRVSSKASGRFRWEFGGFFYHSNAKQTVGVGINTLPLSTLPPGQTALIFVPFWETPGGFASVNDTVVALRDTQYSGFVDGEFDILKNLSLRVELRDTDEEKAQQVEAQSFSPGVTSFPGVHAGFHFVNTRDTLKYQYNSAIMFYVSAANGTKSGGFNQNADVPQDVSYQPEQNWTYEAGFKATFFNHRLQIDAAGYKIDWTNLQLQVPATDYTHNPADVYKNFGAVKNAGFEVETVEVLAPWARFNVGLAYTDPRFASGSYDAAARDVGTCSTIPQCAGRVTTFRGAPALSLNNNRLPWTSNWQVTAGLTLDGSFTPDLTWSAGGQYAYMSKAYGDVDNLNWWGARNIVNLQVGLQYKNYEVAVMGRNLLDDTTPTFTNQTTQLNTFNNYNGDRSYIPDGREVWVRLAAHF